MADLEGEETGGDIVWYECENGHTFSVPQRPQGGAAPREGEVPPAVECPVCGSSGVEPVPPPEG